MLGIYTPNYTNRDGGKRTMCDEITTSDSRVLFKIDEEYQALAIFVRSNDSAEWDIPVLFDADDLWAMVMPDTMVLRGSAESPPHC